MYRAAAGNLLRNLYAYRAHEERKEHGFSGWVLVGSTLGARNDGVNLGQSAIAELSAVILLMISLLFRRRYIQSEARRVQEAEISAADYTVHCQCAEGMEPLNFASELEVRAYTQACALLQIQRIDALRHCI